MLRRFTNKTAISSTRTMLCSMPVPSVRMTHHQPLALAEVATLVEQNKELYKEVQKLKSTLSGIEASLFKLNAKADDTASKLKKMDDNLGDMEEKLNRRKGPLGLDYSW